MEVVRVGVGSAGWGGGEEGREGARRGMLRGVAWVCLGLHGVWWGGVGWGGLGWAREGNRHVIRIRV